MTSLPRALLLDLDDTILDAHRNPDEAWGGVCREFAGRVGAPSLEALQAAVLECRGLVLGGRRTLAPGQARHGGYAA